MDKGTYAKARIFVFRTDVLDLRYKPKIGDEIPEMGD